MPRPHPRPAAPPVPIAPHHLSTTPLLPAPIGLASSASRPPRAAIRIPLCRHRADPALIAPPITTIVRRHPHRAHRAPPPSYTCCASPPASRPPCADIRVTPPSLSSRCGGPRALAGKNRAVCIPFSPNARERPSSWQHPPEMHAFRDQDGNILAPCIHFRAQSGDSGCMARESCRQGPSFASRNPKPRMARRCCQRRAAFPRQRPAVRPNGLCAMRQRHATRGMAERALRPAARAWPACRMRPPAISLVPAAARVHRRRLICVALRRPHRVHRAQPSAAPPIAIGVSADRALPAALVLPTPTHRVHRCALAGTARAPTRANRAPAPSQPGLVHPWSRLPPPAPHHPPRLTLPRGSRCGSGNSREMMR